MPPTIARSGAPPGGAGPRLLATSALSAVRAYTGSQEVLFLVPVLSS